MTGFLNIDKREGDTSTYVVNRVKGLTKCPCGHMGTLDPLACGVLPVGIGNAARLFDYFLGKTKTYLAKFRFGVTTDSLDRESPLKFGGRVPEREEIEKVLPEFLGEILQVPPAYSAKFIDGKRSYDLARAGKKIQLDPKKVKIERFDLIDQTGVDEFSFEIVCGGGTYIRSLARDLSKRLNTFGFMSALERTQSGVFTKQTSVPLERLTRENFRDFLIPTEDVLPFPRLDVSDERYYRGVRYEVEARDGLYKVFRDGEFYGTAKVENGQIRPDKKLC